MTDLSGVLDEDGFIRLSVVRLSEALLSLLGIEPGPTLAGRLRELAELVDELAEVCRQRADRLAQGGDL